MSFAQTNYQEHLGNGPYTIAEIGCFITSFCNLEQEAFGKNIDPPTLNQFFIDHGNYLADPSDGAGVHDDVGWATIAAWDPTIHVTRVVDHGTAQTAGWPSTANAIVKFYYTGHSGAKVTHFCKVADPSAGTIVDSWDGKVKVPGSYYGQPVAFAEYAEIVPQPVPVPIQPPAPAAAPKPVDNPAVVPNTTGVSENVTVTASLLNVREAPTVNSPAHEANTTDGGLHGGDVIKITGWVHADDVQGNDVWLRSIRGNWIWSGGTNFDLNQTKTPMVAAHVDPSPAPAPAAEPAAAPLPQLVNNIPTPGAESITVKVVPFTDTFKPAVGTFKAIDTVQVVDISGKEGPLTLTKGMLVQAAGTFSKDGVKYVRTVNSVKNGLWYGIPTNDLVPAQNPQAVDGIGDIKPVAKKLDDDIASIPDDIFADIDNEGKQLETLKGRERLIADVSKTEGFLSKVFHKNKGVK